MRQALFLAPGVQLRTDPTQSLHSELRAEWSKYANKQVVISPGEACESPKEGASPDLGRRSLARENSLEIRLGRLGQLSWGGGGGGGVLAGRGNSMC